jgi:hypothetical protein
VDSHYKKPIALKASGALNNELSTKNDVPIPNDGAFFETHQKELLELIYELKRFKLK